MPKSHEIAAELRKLAESIEKIDESIELPYAFVFFQHNSKDSFLAAARTMLKPFKKETIESTYRGPDIRLSHNNASIHLWNEVPKSLTCTLVKPAQPAVYDCDPLLSDDEEAELVDHA